MTLCLFTDYPDLYQALAAISADEAPDASDARTVAGFSEIFRERVSDDITRLEKNVSPLPLERIADIAQWPDEEATILEQRYRVFVSLVGKV